MDDAARLIIEVTGAGDEETALETPELPDIPPPPAIPTLPPVPRPERPAIFEPLRAEAAKSIVPPIQQRLEPLAPPLERPEPPTPAPAPPHPSIDTFSLEPPGDTQSDFTTPKARPQPDAAAAELMASAGAIGKAADRLRAPGVGDARPPQLPPIAEQIKAILADPGAKKLGFKSANDVAATGTDFIETLYKGIRATKPAEMPGEAPAKPATQPQSDTRAPWALERTTQERLNEIKRAILGMPRPPTAQVAPGPGQTAATRVPPAPQAAAEPPADVYGFQDAKDRVEAGPRYDVHKAEGESKATANAAQKKPPIMAESVYDPQKSRQKWTGEGAVDDLKGMLPLGLGNKLEEMKNAFYSGRQAAVRAGAAPGGARAAMAGVGEAAVAAGPAIAIAAVLAVQQKMVDVTNKAAKSVEALGTQAARFAENDHLGMFNAAVDGTAETLEEIPVLGKKYAAELRLAAAPVRAFATAVEGFNQRSRELAPYSGPISAAASKAEVRSLLLDIKEANRMGGVDARLIDASSRANAELREMLLPLKEVTVKVLTWVLETGMSVWDFSKPILAKVGENMFELLQVVEEIGKSLPMGMGDAVTDLLKEMERGRKLDKRLEEFKSAGPILDWLGAADNLGRNPMPIAPGTIPPGPIFPKFPGANP